MLKDIAGLNPLTQRIIGAGIEVHKTFGAGLLESIYTNCLVIELKACGMNVEVGRRFPVTYRGIRLNAFYEADLIVEGSVVVEVKAVAALAPLHRAQLITYLKLTGCPLGLLMNFNVPLLKAGILRVTGQVAAET